MTDVLRHGRASLAFGFFAQGLAFALLVTRIPAIQDRYGVSDALLPVFLLMPASALAADAGVPGKKLVITEKTNGDSSVSLTLAKDDGIQKGGGVARNELEGLDGSLEIFFSDAPSSVRGAFLDRVAARPDAASRVR